MVDYFCACYEVPKEEDLVKARIFANLGVFGRIPLCTNILHSIFNLYLNTQFNALAIITEHHNPQYASKALK